MTLSSRVGRSAAWEDRLDTIAKLIAVATPQAPRTHIDTSGCKPATRVIIDRTERLAADQDARYRGDGGRSRFLPPGKDRPPVRLAGVPHDHGEWPQISDRLGEIFCLTFIRSSDDADALRRMGALSDTVGQRTLGDLAEEAQEFDHGYPTVAAAARLDGWTVMIEPGGFEGSDTALLSAVSEGSEAVSVLRHAYASNRFGYAAAGRLVTGFDPSWPGRRWGTHPDRLLSVMDEVGMTPDDPDAGYVEGTLPALELAGRITGVGVPLRVLDEPLLSAWIEPWFSDAVPPPVSNGDPLMPPPPPGRTGAAGRCRCQAGGSP